jgi:predicted LPLAT superfamily acyltransferase
MLAAGGGAEWAASSAPVARDRAESRWMDVTEKGTSLGVRLVLALGALVGRGGVRLLLAGVALYYAVFHGAVRRASASYLGRVLGRPARLADVWRHLRTFAEVTYDRVLFLRGRAGGLELVSHGGIRHLAAQQASGRGALVLGAHLGSFEAMRARSELREVPVHALVYQRHAPMITAFLRGLSPALAARLIEIDPASPQWVLGLQDRIEAGQLVALLGDRAGLNEKHVTVEFLGAPARFPTGPYLLAALLQCPIYLAAGLYTPPGRYDFHCEPLFERIELPRGRRDEVLRACASRYAARLEQLCRAAPYNWFNFHDVWESPPSPAGGAR